NEIDFRVVLCNAFGDQLAVLVAEHNAGTQQAVALALNTANIGCVAGGAGGIIESFAAEEDILRGKRARVLSETVSAGAAARSDWRWAYRATRRCAARSGRG